MVYAINPAKTTWGIRLTSMMLVLGMILPAVGAQDAAQPTPPPAVVQMIVNPPVVTVGETVTVSANLLNFGNLYGLQVSCAVDAGLLAGLGRADGDAFNAANSFFVDEGLKPDGKWLIAATRLQPAPPFAGNGVAFSFQYHAQAAGSSSVSCTALASDPFSIMLPLEVQGTSSITVNPVAVVETVVPLPTVELPTSVPTEIPAEPNATEIPLPTEVILPTETPLPTEVILPTETALPTEAVLPTATPAAEETVLPTVETPVAAAPATIQGIVGYPIGATQAGINVFLTVDGNLLGQVVTGEDGSYRFNDVPAGTYTVLLSAVEHLTVSYTVTVAGDGALLDLGSATLITGDTDGNQIVDLADSVLVSANFDQPVPPAPENADLNHDGQINVADLVLIGGNYGRSGPIEMP